MCPGTLQTDKENETRFSPGKDRGYAWVILAATFAVNIISDGVTFSVGLFLVEFLETFGEGRGYTGIIAAVLVAAMHMIGPVAGMLSDKFGCRTIVIIGSLLACVGLVTSYLATSVFFLCFSFGLTGGLGLGLMYVPASICVTQYFEKRLGVANGIASCGSGLGTLAFSQMVPRLIAEYSWRGTLLILAGIQLNGVIFGLLLHSQTKKSGNINNVHQNGNGVVSELTTQQHSTFGNTGSPNLTSIYQENPNGHLKARETGRDELSSNDSKHFCFNVCTGLCSFELLRNLKFWMVLVACFIIQFAFTTPYQFLPDQVDQAGIEKTRASWLISCIGIFNTVSRVALGWLGDRSCVNRLVVLVLVLFLAGISTGVSPWMTSFEAKLLYACLIGTFLGGFVALMYTVLVDLFGAENFSKSFGLVMFTIGVSSLISTPFGGWLFDTTGSYHSTFIVAGSEFIVGGIIIALCKCVPNKSGEYTL